MRSQRYKLAFLQAALLSLQLSGNAHANDPTVPVLGNETPCAQFTGIDYTACLIGASERCAHEVMKRVRPDYRPRMPFYTKDQTTIEAGTSDHITRIDLSPNDTTGQIHVTFREEHLAFKNIRGHAVVVGGTKTLIKTQALLTPQPPIHITSQWGVAPVNEMAAYVDALTANDLYQSCMLTAIRSPQDKNNAPAQSTPQIK